MTNTPLHPDQLGSIVTQSLAAQPVTDMHTHLYPPTFGTPTENQTGRRDPDGLLLWGVDELLTYHYLVAEVYRIVPATKLPYEQFWRMTKTQQADHVWKHLFLDRPPISEACRGVLTALNMLGLDPGRKDLRSMRQYFKEQNPDRLIDRVMELSNVNSITMTNAVFDDNERARWNDGIAADSRFKAVLRIDPMLRSVARCCTTPSGGWLRGGQHARRPIHRRSPPISAGLARPDKRNLYRRQSAA
jgi:hypothetical protein